MQSTEKNKKPPFQMPTSFAILAVLLIILALATLLASRLGAEGVTGATLSMTVLAPVNGFTDAVPVCLFVMILGGFLGVVAKTGALDAGITTLVHKLKGRELMLIPILMTLFSVGGTTFGMGEETVPFYFLLAATMYAAGFDALVGASMVLLGAGSGVLGSTINPFATGAAIDSLSESGLEINQGIVIAEGAVLWVVSLVISIAFVMHYAKKVQSDPSRSILTLEEKKQSDLAFCIESNVDGETKGLITRRQKGVLVVFALAFVTMIVGVISWETFGVNCFAWSAALTGVPFGQWYYSDTTTVFLLTSVIVAFVGKLTQREFVDAFVGGVGEIMGVVLVIALARSFTVLMAATGFDLFVLTSAAEALSGVSALVFAPLSYCLYVLLSFLVPSSSGLATLSVPIMAPLASQLGFSPETMIMVFSAGNGLVNLFTPTCGFIMGGLAIAKIEYSTWLKFSGKVILSIAAFSMVFLTLAMLVL